MKKYYIFKIQFIDGIYQNAIDCLKNDAFMIVPSGPGLATIGKDLQYTKAVQNADFAIPDSGYMVILYRLYFHKKIKKISSPKFIKSFYRGIIT